MEVFSESSFSELMYIDNQTYLARQALVRVKDKKFCEFYGSYINDLFESNNFGDETIEDSIIPLLIDFGVLANQYLPSSHLDKVKDFIYKSLSKDKAIVEQALNGVDNNQDSRKMWVRDNVAYWVWTLGWADILHDLKKQDWYWLSIFSEWWEDSDSNNLLVWSLLHDNEILRNRAIHVMKSDNFKKIDGAIAWKRINRLSEKA
jgi:general stress protein 26